MSKSKEFTKQVLDEIGYYVYVYSDPETNIPFYIGKGKGNRCFNHLFLDNESEKVSKIHEIQSRGQEPKIEILVRGVDEETALKVEAAAIDLIGVDKLTNIQKGHHSSEYGRIDVDELNARSNQVMLAESDIDINAVLIKINQAYHYGMSDFEIYEATRSCWRMSPEKANEMDYCFAIYDGMIIEVYKIAAWVPCHTTLQGTRENFYDKEIYKKDEKQKRIEFVGTIAEEDVRERYKGSLVSDWFKYQNPIYYVFGKNSE